MVIRNLLRRKGRQYSQFWISYRCDVFAQVFVVVMILGLFGGIYPALRATRLEPIEALRYE